MRNRPDIIIGGATRSGLDGFVRLLDHHPQIFIPQRREHKFFHRENILEKAPPTIQYAFFDAAHEGLEVRLEEDRVLHCEQEYDPERAYLGCPNAKVIFTLRDPIVRAHAQFYHALSEGKETVRSFEHAVDAELSGLRSPETTGRCWLYKNQFQKHLEHWMSFYDRDKMHVQIYEEWIGMDQGVFRRTEDFLGLKPGSLVIDDADGFDRGRKVTMLQEPDPKKYPPLSTALREQLEDFFEVDKMFISNFLNRPIPAWSEKA